jgi:molybdenum cofactor cytidylyltransferase
VRIGAIVLAAGKSERMGRPKALLALRGRTFIETILDAISRSPVEHTVVVVGHHPDEIEPHVATFARTVLNPDYEKGMITSIQAGIRALPAGMDGALLFLVDHPVVDSESIQSLLAHASPDRIVVPMFEGRRGHPVFFGMAVLEEVLALPASEGANIVVRRDPGRIVQVSVNSPGVLMDVDTPEDYRNLQSKYEPR